ncbi:hypothetical protein DESC_500055 [Desulfosarcina cetonica]|nr:hypothetical protein DESC_500055 [Desulfosarcina cetonica]
MNGRGIIGQGRLGGGLSLHFSTKAPFGLEKPQSQERVKIVKPKCGYPGIDLPLDRHAGWYMLGPRHRSICAFTLLF